MTPNAIYDPEKKEYDNDSDPMVLLLNWKCKIADIEPVHNNTKLKYVMERYAPTSDITDIRNALRVFFKPKEPHRFLIIIVKLDTQRCLEYSKEGKEYKYDDEVKGLSIEELIKEKQQDFDYNMQDDSHANCIIFDKKNKTVERFEPHGAKAQTSVNAWFDVLDLDKTFQQFVETWLKTINVRWKFNYLPPESYWHGKGIQQKIELGMCYLIIFVWIDLRLSFNDISPTDLSRILSEELKITNVDWLVLTESYLFAHKSILEHLLEEEKQGRRKGFTRRTFKLDKVVPTSPMETTKSHAKLIDLDISRLLIK